VRYLYIDNFRGFRHTLICLRDVNFLVGENSTGKSSLLSLLQLMDEFPNQYYPGLYMTDEVDLGAFGDIVSVWSSDRSYFKVAVVGISAQSDGDEVGLDFAVRTFENRDGIPHVKRFTALSQGRQTTFVFDRTRTRYRTISAKSAYPSEEAALEGFRTLLEAESSVSRGFRLLPSKYSPNPPIPIAMSLMREQEKESPLAKSDLPFDLAPIEDLQWIAPIRAKSRRTYDAVSRPYSPEGEHAPFVLRRSLKSGPRSSELVQRLRDFGAASGLFETVRTHAFGRGSDAPFEVVVHFAGADLNISNVGYGVSQALPLIVDFLTARHQVAFAVQQPEIHLHPRAQAALGGLLFELALEGPHTLLVETHSDYVIDRYRLSMKREESPPDTQVLFFERTASGNVVHSLLISNDGQYPAEQPPGFRDFFIREELELLGV